MNRLIQHENSTDISDDFDDSGSVRGGRLPVLRGLAESWLLVGSLRADFFCDLLR